MKIQKIRIKNYKSIIDSGDCYLTNDVTILAGKNESGKTSILEALRDFDTKLEIKEEVKPIKGDSAVPEISITFEIEKSNLKKIYSTIGLEKPVSNDTLLEIIKTFPNQFSISEHTKKELRIFDNTNKKNAEMSIKKSINIIKAIQKKHPEIGSNIPEFDDENLSEFENQIDQFKNNISQTIENISDVDEKKQISLKLEKILDSISKLKSLQNLEEKFIDELKRYIPYFIFFNSFEDIFPNKIPFDKLDNNEWIKDLSIISNLNIDTIKNSNDRSKEKHKDDVNVKINKDYKNFWRQDISKLSITYDSEHLYFWIKEGGYTYEPKNRSKGRQWHLAFYIKVTARAKEGVPNIILIDEPGLFLHAQAQKDILKKLENSAEEAQLIFSTHSPYLLESEKLNRIRLIHKSDKRGTKIENKVHALADKETLTPILTAIGLGVNSGISNFKKTNNIVVEGISDCYYLNAFKKIFNKENLNFIYGGGAGNMPFIGTILNGWGCKVLYLYDNDKGKKDGQKNLKKNWHITNNLILSITDNKGDAIEDIFSKNDFKKHILKNEGMNYEQSNSQFLKNKNNKVLLAKQFLESNENIKNNSLDETTKKKIEKLFKKVETAFNTK